MVNKDEHIATSTNQLSSLSSFSFSNADAAM